MRIPVAALIVIGLSYLSISQVNSNPLYTRGLHDDLADFVALVPKDEITAIVFDYVQNDEEVKFVIEYIQTAEFRELVNVVEAMPDVINFYNYLQESGLNIYDAVNKIHDLIGLPPLIPSKLATLKSRSMARGVAGLIAEIKMMLPSEDIKALYHYKLENSIEFRQLVERLQSPRFQTVVDALIANGEFQYILSMARENGIDVQAVADLLASIFGLEFPFKLNAVKVGYQSPVYVNFDDFSAEIEKDVIADVVQRYITYDEEIQTIAAYLKTDDFIDALDHIHHLDTVNSFYQYLDQSGLDIYTIIEAAKTSLDALRPHMKNSVNLARAEVPPTRGLAGLIDEIMFSLPLGKWFTLYEDRKLHDPAFAYFIERLTSDDFRMTVKAIIEDKMFVASIGKWQAGGFDVTPIIDFIKTALHIENVALNVRGHHYGDLHNDFQDFLTLLPFDKIIQIGHKYLLSDPQVQEAVKYVTSNEIRDLIIKLQNDEEVYEVLMYFEDSGAGVISLLNMLNEVLGMPKFPEHLVQKLAFSGNNLARSGGVPAMLNDIRAVLPYDKIKAMYEYKVEHSDYFKYFVDRMYSPELQKMIDKIVDNENILELAHQASLRGIDINKIADILGELFGLQFPEYPVKL